MSDKSICDRDQVFDRKKKQRWILLLLLLFVDMFAEGIGIECMHQKVYVCLFTLLSEGIVFLGVEPGWIEIPCPHCPPTICSFFFFSSTCLASYRGAACTLVSRHEWKKEYWAKSHLVSKETPPSGRVARPRANKSDFMNDEFRKCLEKNGEQRPAVPFRSLQYWRSLLNLSSTPSPEHREMIKGEERARRKRKEREAGEKWVKYAGCLLSLRSTSSV